jgi:hypothetical protein
VNRVGFAGLIKIEFPANELRLCDGGFIDWGADRYTSNSATFGTIAALEAVTEGIGEEVPVFELTLLPPGDTPTSTLAAPGYQAARARFWLAEYDMETGLLVGDPDLQFDGQVDSIALTFGRGVRTMTVSIVSNTARLLERNIGNSLNSAFHKSIWPGETGHDNADGLGRQIAWGVEAGR